VHLLRARASTAVITNPSPTPPRFAFFVRRPAPASIRRRRRPRKLRRADLIVVLDISDLTRLGMLIETVRDRGVPVACVDHHVSAGIFAARPRYLDPDAAATGELIFEIAKANDWPVTKAVARALYVAILTDTGRVPVQYTRPDLTSGGRSPGNGGGCGAESTSRFMLGRRKAGRGFFAEALADAGGGARIGLAWVTVRRAPSSAIGVVRRPRRSVEFPRSIEGVRMALLFRRSPREGKVSLRSVGDVDVAAFAKAYGGGGHTKAAGLSLTGSAGRSPGDGAEGCEEVKSGGRWKSLRGSRVWVEGLVPTDAPLDSRL